MTNRRKSLYVVEQWWDSKVGWCFYSFSYELRDAKRLMSVALQNCAWSGKGKARMRRWVRPTNVGVHGWMKEAK